MRLEAGLHLAIATPAQRDRALSLTHALWGGGVELADYQERTAAAMRSDWGREHYAFYVAFGPAGEIQASCKVYELPMWALGRPIRTLGLGAVFTAPEYRHKGVATRMLQALLERYAAQGFRLATLFSDIEPTFYERLGFRRLTSRDYRAIVSNLPPPPADASWRQVTAADSKLLVALHESAARSFSLSYGRTPELRQFLLERARAELAVLERGGEPLGYAAYSCADDEICLYEWGAADLTAAGALVRSLPLLGGNARQLFGWLPEGAPAADLPFDTEDRDRPVWMVAPLGDDPPPVAALRSGPHHAWLIDHF